MLNEHVLVFFCSKCNAAACFEVLKFFFFFCFINDARLKTDFVWLTLMKPLKNMTESLCFA